MIINAITVYIEHSVKETLSYMLIGLELINSYLMAVFLVFFTYGLSLTEELGYSIALLGDRMFGIEESGQLSINGILLTDLMEIIGYLTGSFVAVSKVYIDFVSYLKEKKYKRRMRTLYNKRGVKK